MAEEDKSPKEELSENETAELEKLLAESEGEETAEGAEASGEEVPKGIVQRLKSDKKLLIMAVAGFLLLTSTGGGAYWYFFMQAPPLEEQTKLEDKKDSEADEEELPDVDKAQVSSLEPFFLALEENGLETVRFIKVVPHLLLSNSALGEEVDKILPQIRRGIYIILRRTDPMDFVRNQVKAEEKIKSQIITESNANLLSGTGTITDVFYTQFMIK
jgi:flagellar basal body-associated protein FliL